jgi:hypothetical protein
MADRRDFAMADEGLAGSEWGGRIRPGLLLTGRREGVIQGTGGDQLKKRVENF